MNDAVTLWPEIPGIDTDRAKEICLDDPEFYQILLRTFVHEAVIIRDELANALGSSDTELSLKLLHKLRGMAYNLGATDFAAHATAVEEGLRKGILPAHDLPDMLGVLIAAVQQSSDRTPTVEIESAADSESLGALQPQLEQLRVLLTDNNLAALNLWESLRTQLRPVLDQSEWGQLDGAISMLQFAEAMGMLNRFNRNGA